MSNYTNDEMENMEIFDEEMEDLCEKMEKFEEQEEKPKKKRGRKKKDENNEDVEKNDVKFIDTFERSFTKNVVKKNPITSRAEASNLVKQYYDIQAFRMASGNRQGQLDKKGTATDKNISFKYASAGLKQTEVVIKKWLEEYIKNEPIGQWMLSIKGIGPVLAAGLYSYIDITKCPTAGHIWSYAGWEGHNTGRKRGQKLDYNPDFRVLCWKIGDSFQKQSGKIKENSTDPTDMYCRIYQEKLRYYEDKNNAGGFAEFAAQILTEKNFTNQNTRAIYQSGKLPHIHMVNMAKRYAAKFFISHLQSVWYEYEFKEPAPKPFVIAHLNHVDYITPPNKDILGL